MPDYQTPRYGVSIATALAEAAAVSPVSRVMLDTFELSHPSLESPVRVVNDHSPLMATLEDAADYNAGEEVEFLACPVTVTRPEESDTAATPEITLAVDNVSGAMSEALRIARGSLVPWQIVNRVYSSDDTSAPAIMPPLKLQMTSVDISGTQVVIKASFGDANNTSVPRLTFKRSEYPGLAIS